MPPGERRLCPLRRGDANTRAFARNAVASSAVAVFTVQLGQTDRRRRGHRGPAFEQWRDDGGKDAAQRANETWKRMLREYEAPPLDPAIDEALKAFVARRKEKLPDSVA